jgi:hypothetical protein
MKQYLKVLRQYTDFRRKMQRMEKCVKNCPNCDFRDEDDLYDEYDRKINGETRKAGNRVGVIF